MIAQAADLEIVGDPEGLLIRRQVVGELDTNCWIVASIDTRHGVLIDPGDEPSRVLDAADDLTIDAIVLTHSHWDHVLGLPTVADALGCPVRMHRHDAAVWPGELSHLQAHGHFDAGTATDDLLACGCHLALDADTPTWDGVADDIDDGDEMTLGRPRIRTIHTPGHTPGGISLLVGHHLFSGDTLFPGGPGLTGWPLSDFPTIINSIRRRLFTLPDTTHVHPGHGPSTTIGAQRPHLDDWIARGW